MKRSFKLLTVVFTFALLVTLGCVIASAAPVAEIEYADAVKDDVVLGPGEEMTYTDADGIVWTITNPTPVSLTARYFGTDYSVNTEDGSLVIGEYGDRYAFGTYYIHTNDAKKYYKGNWFDPSEDPIDDTELVRSYNWVNTGYVYTDGIDGLSTYVSTFDPDAEVGTYEKGNSFDFHFEIIIPGVNSYELENSVIVVPNWGEVEVVGAEIDVTAEGYTGVYDGLPHSGTVVAIPTQGGTATVYYSEVSSADAHASMNTTAPAYTNAGTYTVYYYVEAANHVAVEGSYTVEITKKALTQADYEAGNLAIVLNPAQFDYDSLMHAPTVQTVTVDGLVLAETADFVVAVVEQSEVGTYTLAITGKGNYEGTVTVEWTIDKVDNAWTAGPSIADWIYNEPAATPVAESRFGTVVITYKVAGAADSTYSATVPTNAGNYTMKAFVAGTANYNELSATVDFTIAKATLDAGILAQIAQLGTYTYNGEVQAILSNIDQLVEDGVLPEYLTANGTTIDMQFAGVADVAYELTFANYEDVSGVWTATLEKASIAIKTNDKTACYNGDELKAEGWTIVDGQLFGTDNLFNEGAILTYAGITYITAENAVYDADGRVLYGVVENTLVYDEADVNSNYSVTVVAGTLTLTPAELQIKMIPTEEGYVYDGRSHTYMPILQGVLSPSEGADEETIARIKALLQSEKIGIATNKVELTRVNAGVTEIQPEQIKLFGVAKDPDGNWSVDTSECYRLVAIIDSPKIVIRPAEVTLDFGHITVEYGNEVDPAVLYSQISAPTLIVDKHMVDDVEVEHANVWNIPANLAGVVFHYAKNGTEYDTTCGVGTGYSIVVESGISIPLPEGCVTSEGDDESNYDITYVGTMEVVKREITYTVDDAEVVYGSEPVFSGSFGANNLVNGDVINVAYICDYTTTTDADTTHEISAEFAGDVANYNVTVVPGTLTVTKAVFNVTITAETLTYNGDAQAPVLTPAVSGLVNNQPISYTYSMDSAIDAGTYTVSFVASAPNHEDVEGEFTFTIKPYAITNVTWEGNNFVYNGEEQGPTAVAIGPKGEVLEISSTKEIYVGRYEAVAKDIVGCNSASFRPSNYVLIKIGMDTGYFTINEVQDVIFTSASLTIGSNYAVNFKVPVLAFEQYGVMPGDEDFFITALMEGKDQDTLIKTATVQTVTFADGSTKDYYVFSFDKVAPQEMNKEIVVTLNVKGATDTRSYSVAEYCYSQLDKNRDDARFTTVLIALLRYGAEAQKYEAANERAAVAAEDLATYKLENVEPFKSLYAGVNTTTSYVDDDPTTSNYNPATGITNQAVNIMLNNGITFRYTIYTNGADLENLKFVVRENGVKTELPVANIQKTGYGYVIDIPVDFVDVTSSFVLMAYVDGAQAAYYYCSVDGYAANAADTVKPLACALVDFGTLLDKYLENVAF